jgi:hypothetical protein
MYLDKQFADYKNKNKNATIVLLWSLMSTEQLATMGLKTMANDFPVINTIVMKDDNMFPPLNWQQVAFKV